MHTISKASLSFSSLSLLNNLISEFSLRNHTATLATGILFLKISDNSLTLSHSELHIVREALTDIANTPRISATTHLQSLQAHKLLELLTLSTTTTEAPASTKTTGTYVCLQGIKHGNRFYTSHSPKDSDPTKLSTGEVAYTILGFADTSEEAQQILGIA